MHRRGVARTHLLLRLVQCVLAAIVVVSLVVEAASATTTAASSAPEDGSIGIRLVDVPTDTRNDPRARLYIVDHLAPGTIIHRRIEVSNTTSSTAHVGLYPAAAGIKEGAFLGAAGHTRNDLSTWTTVRPREADIPPFGSVTAIVTVRVPFDAAQEEQYGAIWAETRSTPGGDGGVTQVNRVGLRIYLSVGPGGPPAANFSIDSLTAKRSPEGQPMVLATVHNSGGRALDMSGTLRLSEGPGGLQAGPFPASPGTTLAIGATAPVLIALDEQLPAGPWDARISLHSGLLQRSERATITFPAAGTSPPVSTSGSGWLYLVIGLGILSLLGVGVLLVVLRRRRRRDNLELRKVAPLAKPVSSS
jgi:hypothetical protein